jgi:hypothetical protein
MDGLQLLQNGYKMVYFYCSDATSSKSEIGITITNDRNTPLTDKETKIVKSSLQILIARVPYYLNRATVEIK